MKPHRSVTELRPLHARFPVRPEIIGFEGELVSTLFFYIYSVQDLLTFSFYYIKLSMTRMASPQRDE